MAETQTYSNYQLSTVGVGVVATGLADIRQCIDIILRTIPGSDPLRPLFGANVWQFVDKPSDVAIPNIKKAIVEALREWEPRISVTAVRHQENKENLAFEIAYTITDSDLSDTIIYAMSGENVDSAPVGGLIISTLIPAKIVNGRYNVTLVLNDVAAFPSTPLAGFATAAEMLTWLRLNWAAYGTWNLADGKLVLYVKSSLAVTSASLLVTQKAIVVAKAFIPLLAVGEYYNLQFTLNGNNITGFAANINNVEAMLLWLQSNWSAYGIWSIENNGATQVDQDFNEDFNQDFAIGGTLPLRNLVFQTENYQTAEIAFI